MKTTALALTIACLAAFAHPAAAEEDAPEQPTSVCGDRTEIINTLRNSYAEQPRAMGLAGNGAMVELFISKAGSWTILVTRPTGVACMAAAGQHWEELVAEKSGI